MFGLATGRAGVSPSTVAEINVDDADLPARLAALGPDTSDDSFCLNDTERVMPGPDGPRGLVTTFLRRRFPTPAPWELDADDPGRALDYTATSVPPPELTSATAFASSSASSLAR
jgi:hypothetical protein